MLLQKQLMSKDCWRTCIAAILNVEAKTVPHFYDLAQWDADIGGEMGRKWLNDRGYHLISVQFGGDASFQDVLQIASTATNGLPYILSGIAKGSKQNHAIVCQGAEVIMDPLIGISNPKPFAGPCKEGFWVLEIVVKAPD